MLHRPPAGLAYLWLAWKSTTLTATAARFTTVNIQSTINRLRQACAGIQTAPVSRRDDVASRSASRMRREEFRVKLLSSSCVKGANTQCGTKATRTRSTYDEPFFPPVTDSNRVARCAEGKPHSRGSPRGENHKSAD